jgi:CheY-like chemotaxis protein
VTGPEARTARNLVMVVDDDPDIRTMMELVLEGSGYAVTSAGDGAEALHKLEDGMGLPCLILLDLRLPGMDGQQFREAQLADPRLARVPVTVVSGDGDIAARATALGTDHYLMKPVPLDALLEEVGRYCCGRG